MLVEIERWHTMYEEVVSQVRIGGGSVSLLCHTDADALCAARMWAFALRADGVAYSIHPCFDWDDLKDKLESTQQTAVLFNVGATVNLSVVSSANRKIHVLDALRPFHLANVHSPHVVLWQDNDDWESDVPSDGDNLSGEDSSDEEDSDSDDESDGGDDSDSDSDGEAEFQDDDDFVHKNRQVESLAQDGDLSKQQDTGYDADSDRGYDEDRKEEHEKDFDDSEADIKNEISAEKVEVRDGTKEEDSITERDQLKESGKRKRSNESIRRSLEMQDSFLSDDDDEDQDNSDNNQENVKRSRGSETPPEALPESMHERHLQRKRRIRAYYSGGTYYSSPVSYMAYSLLSSGLRHGSNGDLLWLACVGVTDALLHNRLDHHGYEAFADQLSTQVHHLFPHQSDLVTKTTNSFYAESIQPSLLSSQLTHNAEEQMTLVTKCETGRISVQNNEFRFFLLRHLSLWNAMRYSNIVSSQMQLYTKSGTSKLKELLAQIGVPLAECRQPYAFLKPTLKRRIQNSLLETAPQYGLEEDKLVYNGFCRVTGYQSLTSASDIVYAVTAILECSEDSFNMAYDSLNANASFLVNGGSSTDTLSKGIRLAMWLQRAIFSTAASLIERRAITRLTHFRYAFIHCTHHHGSIHRDLQASDSSGEKSMGHIFTKPLALTKLATYLFEIHRSKWKEEKARPLILLAEDPLNSCYWIVGFSWEKKNRFGQLFQYTAQTLSLETRRVALESHVLQIMGGSSEAQRFVEQLHYMMDSI